MRNVFSVALVAASVFCISCTSRTSSSSPSASEPTHTEAAKPAPGPPTLDLIIGGPFIFVQNANDLTLWIPDVKGHSKPLGFDEGAEPRSFEKGDYDFTKGLRAAAATKILVPVRGGGMLSFSRSKYGLSTRARKSPYLTVKLPTPREILPLNADPITVSDPTTGATAASTARLSTLTILRYDFQAGDVPEMDGQGQPWKARPIDHGTEHILVLAIIPPQPQNGQDEHKHARDAFAELAKLLGIKRKIDFPNVTYTRNQPLIRDVVPDDLLDFLGITPLDPVKSVTGQSTMSYEIVGKINDCKAPAALITP
jgi:hypothetical protein